MDRGDTVDAAEEQCRCLRISRVPIGQSRESSQLGSGWHSQDLAYDMGTVGTVEQQVACGQWARQQQVAIIAMG